MGMGRTVFHDYRVDLRNHIEAQWVNAAVPFLSPLSPWDTVCLMILWVHTCKGRGSTLSILPQEPPNLLFETSVSDWPGAPWTGKELYWLSYCPSPLSFFPQMVSLRSLGWLWSHYPPASVSKSQPPFEIASKKHITRKLLPKITHGKKKTDFISV